MTNFQNWFSNIWICVAMITTSCYTHCHDMQIVVQLHHVHNYKHGLYAQYDVVNHGHCLNQHYHQHNNRNDHQYKLAV